MKLKEVGINNFRCIESCKLEFHDRMNLIIGKNGVGKTSILEAIAVGLGGFISGIDGVRKRNFLQEDIRYRYSKIGDASFNKESFLPIEVDCMAEYNDKVFNWKRSRETYDGKIARLEPNFIVKEARNQLAHGESVLPILSYQSVDRVRAQVATAKLNSSDTKYTRASGYRDCLSHTSNIKHIEAWCNHMEQVSWQKEQKIGEYEGAKEAVSRFMTIMEGNQPCSVYYDKQSLEILYAKGEVVESISSLSAGYQSLIWMVFDLAYRMALLNPELREHISEAPGIVLIDEADMHLHPEWQWLLVDALEKVFPNVQFILATHAPIIIASVKNGAIIDVGDINNVSYSEPAYGLDINDTLRQVQESSGEPDEIAALKQRFYEAIDRNNLDLAKQAVLEIESLIGDNKPIAVEARTSYELEAALEE